MSELKKRKEKKRILRYFAVLFLVTLATLFLWRPLLGKLLEKIITNQVCGNFDAECVIDRVQVSAFPPAVEVEGLQLKSETGPLRYLGTDHLRIVPGLGPAFLGRLVIKRAEVSGLVLALQIAETKPKPRQNTLPQSLDLPLRDLIQVELGRLLVDRIQLSVEWPAQDLKLALDEGRLSFKGKTGEEVLSWKGAAKIVRSGRQILVPRVHVKAERRNRSIRLAKVLIEGEKSRVTTSGNVFPDLSLNWTFSSQLGGLEDIFHELEFFDQELQAEGKVSAKGSLEGSMAKWEAKGSLSGSGLSLVGESLGNLQGKFRANASALEEFKFSLKNKTTTLSGEYIHNQKKDDRSRFSLKGKLPYERIERLYQDPKVNTHLKGEVELSFVGSISPKKKLVRAEYVVNIPMLRLELDPVIRPFLPLEFSGIQLQGKVNQNEDGSVKIEDGSLKAEGLSGAYHFRFDEKGSYGDWSAVIDDAGKVFSPDYRIKGMGTVGGGIKIDDENYEILLDINLPELGLANYPKAAFDGDIVFLDKGTELRKFLLSNDETRVTLDAGFSLGEKEETRLKADFSNLSLGWASKVAARKYPIVERIEGRSSGFLELAGLGDELTGKLDAECEPISIKEEGFERAEVRLDFLPEGLRVRPSKVWRENSNIEAKGLIGENGFENFEVQIEMLPFTFFSFPKELSPWFTHVQGEILLNGDSINPKLRGTGRIFRQVENLEYSSVGKLTLGGEFEKLSFQMDLLGRKFLAEGVVDAGSGEDFSAKGVFQEFPLLPHFEEAASFLTGGFLLEGNASEWRTLKGFLSIDQLLARTGDWALESVGNSRIKVDDGNLKLSELKMKGPETDFALSAEVSDSGLLSGNLSGNLELRVLQFLSPDFKRAEGQADIAAGFSGSLSAPEFLGRLRVSRGQLLTTAFPQTFEDISLDVELVGGGANVSSGHASLGGGKMNLSGSVYFPTKSRPLDLQLEAETNRVQLRFPEFIPSTTSGSLQILGPLSKPLFKGQFQVHRAVYRSDWDWKSKILSVRGAGRVDRLFRSDEESLELDLAFTSEGDSIEISNNLAKGKLRGDLNLVGSDQRFGLLGRLELVSGKVEFLDNEFELESGSISFESEDSIDPDFDLNASTRVQDILILLDIRSERDRVEAFLSSDPTRDETSIIALLTLGVDVDDLTEGNAGGSSLSGSILPSVLSGPVQSQLESGLKKAKLIDTLQFVPYYSEDTNTSGLRLIVGKQLFPKVRLLYSTDLFDVGAENTVRVEQKLNDNVSLQGSVRDNREQAEEDYDLGVDFEFRLDF